MSSGLPTQPADVTHILGGIQAMSKSTFPTVTIGTSELEEMIRKIVREELARAMRRAI